MKRAANCRYALLVSYYGAPFQGLQWQPNLKTHTIEKLLWEGLWKAGLIRKSAVASETHALQFSRASRTDKGVSALRQVLSCNLHRYSPSKLSVLNSSLPKEIRVHEAVPVAPSFDAWDWASHRHYSYLMPTYAFASLELSLNEASSFRISKEHLWFVRKMALDFIGGRNFINFTDKKRLAKEFRSRKSFESFCYRYIFDAKVDDPFVYKGVEFCTVHFKGNSFILHQIRKMISVLILLSRGIMTREFLLRNLFREVSVSIPLSPGFPLVLSNLSYDQYNRIQMLKNEGVMTQLNFYKHDKTIRKFAKDLIFTEILDEHVNGSQMLEFSNFVLLTSESCLENCKKYRSWKNVLIFDAPRPISENLLASV